MKSIQKRLASLAASALLAACAVPSPYERPAPPPPSGQQPPETPPEQQPGQPPSTTPEPTPPPAPVVREPTLGAASRALVSQAQTQMATKNYPIAASSIERALRIEPDNPLVWIELAKVHQAEGNHARAENMGRKALALARGDGRAQAASWNVIADSLRARGRNEEAADAERRALEAQRR